MLCFTHAGSLVVSLSVALQLGMAISRRHIQELLSETSHAALVEWVGFFVRCVPHIKQQLNQVCDLVRCQKIVSILGLLRCQTKSVVFVFGLFSGRFRCFCQHAQDKDRPYCPKCL